MKTYIKIILIGSIVVISGVSCERFLDTQSESKFTEEVVFANIDHAEKAVLGIVAGMSTEGLWDRALLFFYNADSDTEFLTGADDNGRTAITRFKATTGNTLIPTTWNGLYKLIERANICIENLGPGTPLWDGIYAARAQRLYGEALTLRALFYYELITNWGDVPWCDEAFKEGVELFKGKTDRDIIYEILIEDLRVAQEYVPWMRELHTTERLGKGYVKGLRARMALAYSGWSLRNGTLEVRRGQKWKEYYQIARDECWELMQSGQHELFPNYETYFRMLHEYKKDLMYGETLWEYPFGRGFSGRLAVQMGLGGYGDPGDPIVGRGQSGITTFPYTFYSHDLKDLRRDVNVALYKYVAATPGIQTVLNQGGLDHSLCKWRKNWIVPLMGGEEANVEYTGINYPMMRYADVVLMFAEAENELNGPTPAAQEALAMVRRRAFKEDDHPEKVTDYIISVSGSKEDFFNAIVDERKWEFCGELIRKKDLVRWRLLEEKVAKAREESLKILTLDHPEYVDLVPRFLFWCQNPTNGEIVIHNPDFPLPDNWHTAAPAPVNPFGGAWERTNWLPRSSEANKTNAIERYGQVSSGYSHEKHNHLYPLHQTTIDDSRGNLSNDQMYP